MFYQIWISCLLLFHVSDSSASFSSNGTCKKCSIFVALEATLSELEPWLCTVENDPIASQVPLAGVEPPNKFLSTRLFLVCHVLIHRPTFFKKPQGVILLVLRISADCTQSLYWIGKKGISWYCRLCMESTSKSLKINLINLIQNNFMQLETDMFLIVSYHFRVLWFIKAFWSTLYEFYALVKCLYMRCIVIALLLLSWLAHYCKIDLWSQGDTSWLNKVYYNNNNNN